MTRTRQLLAVVPVAALLLVVALARSSTADPGLGTGGSPVRGNFSLEEVRALAGSEVYYAGESVAGLLLSAVERRTDEAQYVSFLYGDCTAGDHYGCALPLEIQTWPSCVRSLGLYEEHDPFAPRPERARARGVLAGVLEEGRRLELQTGSSTIVIFGRTRELVVRGLDALQSLDGDIRPGALLRPPVPGAVDGELACP